MDTEAKALKWLINSCGYDRQSIKRNVIGNPDFETTDGHGFEVKTCQGTKFFWRRRKAPGGILFSSMKQWHELIKHPNCKILVFGEGKEPIAVIPMSELPIETTIWHDFSIKVLNKKHPKTVERAVKRASGDGRNSKKKG